MRIRIKLNLYLKIKYTNLLLAAKIALTAGNDFWFTIPAIIKNLITQIS